MPDPEPLVTVETGPGRWQKMTRAQAAANGYEVPDDKAPEAKVREPANKARKAPAKRAPRSGGTRRRSST